MKQYFYLYLSFICVICLLGDDLYARQFRGLSSNSRKSMYQSPSQTRTQPVQKQVSRSSNVKSAIEEAANPTDKADKKVASDSVVSDNSCALNNSDHTKGRSTADLSVPAIQLPPLVWESDLQQALEKAQTEKKMLLALITQPGGEAQTRQLTEWLAAPGNRSVLENSFVCVELDGSAEIQFQGKTAPLLEHPAFREMGRKPGLATIDCQNDDYQGQVVGAFPLIGLRYSQFHINQILNLPPGTLTQRMLTFAIRIHPNRPQSANGRPSCFLMNLAFGHACNQASTHVMGHQNFSYRSSQVMRAHPGTQSSEICAQTGGGVALVGALGLAQLWRGSSAHWSAMKSPSRGWGYDMQRSNNGSWYGCGIFAK